MHGKFRLMAVVLIPAAVGCAGPQKAADGGKPPARPGELDQLDAWVGEWEDTGEVRTAGSDKTEVFKGATSAAWKCDKRFLVEDIRYQVGDGAPESAVAVRTWDPHARLFRTWYFDSHGIIGRSKMTYDAAARTWHGKIKSADPVTCEPVAGEMTLKMADDRTAEWTYTEWDAWKTKKRLEMKGTSRKK
jgi:hypothetical protein